jgi:hypothetical protein
MATLFSQIIDERGRKFAYCARIEFTEAMKNARRALGSGGGRFRGRFGELRR